MVLFACFVLVVFLFSCLVCCLSVVFISSTVNCLFLFVGVYLLFGVCIAGLAYLIASVVVFCLLRIVCIVLFCG